MLQRIKNKKIKTKNLFIVPVGYNKIYREVRTYRFIPINPIYNICVKKDSSIKLQNKMYSFSSAF